MSPKVERRLKHLAIDARLCIHCGSELKRIGAPVCASCRLSQTTRFLSLRDHRFSAVSVLVSVLIAGATILIGLQRIDTAEKASVAAQEAGKKAGEATKEAQAATKDAREATALANQMLTNEELRRQRSQVLEGLNFKVLSQDDRRSYDKLLAYSADRSQPEMMAAAAAFVTSIQAQYTDRQPRLPVMKNLPTNTCEAFVQLKSEDKLLRAAAVHALGAGSHVFPPHREAIEALIRIINQDPSIFVVYMAMLALRPIFNSQPHSYLDIHSVPDQLRSLGLDMRGKRTVGGHDGPVVVELIHVVAAAGQQHRLDR